MLRVTFTAWPLQAELEQTQVQWELAAPSLLPQSQHVLCLLWSQIFLTTVWRVLWEWPESVHRYQLPRMCNQLLQLDGRIPSH